MKKGDVEKQDELRPEYDLRSLRVRRLGPDAKSFGSVVRLKPDVAEVFPDAESVNEALRFLTRITKEKRPPLDEISGSLQQAIPLDRIHFSAVDKHCGDFALAASRLTRRRLHSPLIQKNT
jgi:hypothetical protein